MKARHALVAILACSLVSASGTAIASAQAAGGESKQQGQQQERKPGQPGPGQRGQHQAIMAQLGLSTEQAAAIKLLDEQRRAEAKPGQTKGEPPSTEARKAARAQYHEALAKILTPEQMTKFMELTAKAPEGGKEPRGTGQHQGGTTPPAGAPKGK